MKEQWRGGWPASDLSIERKEGVGCHVAGGEWAAYLRRDRRSKEDHTLLIVIDGRVEATHTDRARTCWCSELEQCNVLLSTHLAVVGFWPD